MKELVTVSYKFLEEIPPQLKYNVKRSVYFSFNFGWYSIKLADHVCGGEGVGLLDIQNRLKYKQGEWG